MAKVHPYHTNEMEYGKYHQNIYHDHDDCPAGQQIKHEHRVEGTDNRDHCDVCKNLVKSVRMEIAWA